MTLHDKGWSRCSDCESRSGLREVPKVRQEDFVLLLKKIAVGVAVAVVPLIIIVSALWLTRAILGARP
jgi:hypothetical protein